MRPYIIALGGFGFFALAATLALPLLARGDERAAVGGNHTAPIWQGGMVVAQEALAARVGADILQKGGNAIDAAVAVGFALAVTFPRAGNIRGGRFLGIHLADGTGNTVDYREDWAAGTD